MTRVLLYNKIEIKESIEPITRNPTDITVEGIEKYP